MSVVVELKPAQGVSHLESMLKAAGDSLRLGVLQVMRYDSYGVLELCELFQIKQPAMSHHLKVLANAGLVTTRRQGNAIFYRRVLPASTFDEALVSQLFDSLDAQPLDEKLKAAVAKTQEQRSEASLSFFKEHSEQFKAKQDLISPVNVYRDTLNEIVDTLLSTLSNKQAVEIGPGDGSYLPDLARRFEHVIALDNAEPMLERCRRAATKKNLDNIGFIHGNTDDLVELAVQLGMGSSVSARRANCIIANMVLHHNVEPQHIFYDVARLLSDNGVFVVSELCQHDQEWVREAAGDIWLGFNEKNLSNWAEQAGLTKKLSSYTALKNGFRIQIHAYTKQ